MAEEETNQNAEEPNQETNFIESTPVDANIADNNPPTTPNNPRRKKKSITVKVIQEKSNHPKIANWIAGISAAISLLLGVITIGLYFEAKNATKLTHEALAHQITTGDTND